jgi:hypothetical protein
MRSVSDRDTDDIRHLRALLKVLLRKYHFRVVEIEQEQDALTAARSARFEAKS